MVIIAIIINQSILYRKTRQPLLLIIIIIIITMTMFMVLSS